MFKLFELIIELFGWIRIVLSPTLIGFGIGAIVYYNKHDNVGLTIGITLAFSGLVIGIIWATRIWKKQGTQQFLSRVDATPDLDKLSEEKK